MKQYPGTNHAVCKGRGHENEIKRVTVRQNLKKKLYMDRFPCAAFLLSVNTMDLFVLLEYNDHITAKW